MSGSEKQRVLEAIREGAKWEGVINAGKPGESIVHAPKCPPEDWIKFGHLVRLLPENPGVEAPERKDAVSRQVGGGHYKDMPIQPGVFCQTNRIPFWESSVIKRMCRHRSKGRAEDLRKAIHEIELILEMEYPDA
jgi:hypothetical protein